MNKYSRITIRQDGSYVVFDNSGTPRHIPNSGPWSHEWEELEQIRKSAPNSVLPADEATDEPTSADLFQQLRTARNRKLSSTDFMMMPDYPLDDSQQAAVSEYRQALRDLPSKQGSPWDGGGASTPWPTPPAVLLGAVPLNLTTTYRPSGA